MRLLREWWPALVGLMLCPVAARFASDDTGAAIARARAIENAERDLGLWIEPAVHGWATARPAVLAVACVIYMWVHVPALGGALVWVYLQRRRAFGMLRDAFLGVQVLTVAGYLLFPTAPPRLLGDPAFADTLTGFWGPGAERSASWLQAPYAAMPSGHVAWALLAGGAVALLARPLWIKALGVLYPLTMAWITLATANHFWMDAVVSALVVAAAVSLRWAVSRYTVSRPAATRAPTTTATASSAQTA